MKTIKYPKRERWKELLARPSIESMSLESKVKEILLDVKVNGDSALKKYEYEFDKVVIDSFVVTIDEFLEAEALVSVELKGAIQLAKNNIEKFHNSQITEVKIIETTVGVACWRKSVGIEKVGIYIPAGSAPLFSSVLMLGIPAKIAGCKEICICSPPDKNGKINPAILYAAKLVGIQKVYKLGGVQAISALAFGTESIPQVYKIVGPGNQYVTCAKQMVMNYGVAIDMPAGPSEVMIFADETCFPAFVAADLLSQAEHGEDSQVILVSTNEEVVNAIKFELQKQLIDLPRKLIAEEALKNSKFILMESIDDSIELVNEYAPEHLIINCKDADGFAENVVNAGSVFIGNYSCESAGDYASGTNHTLPTNGYAKSYSGVSLDTFVKKITFQKITKNGIRSIGPAIELMAEAEGLQAHKNAVTYRLKQLENEI